LKAILAHNIALPNGTQMFIGDLVGVVRLNPTQLGVQRSVCTKDGVDGEFVLFDHEFVILPDDFLKNLRTLNWLSYDNNLNYKQVFLGKPTLEEASTFIHDGFDWTMTVSDYNKLMAGERVVFTDLGCDVLEVWMD
jgi:hypothetical protein